MYPSKEWWPGYFEQQDARSAARRQPPVPLRTIFADIIDSPPLVVVPIDASESSRSLTRQAESRRDVARTANVQRTVAGAPADFACSPRGRRAFCLLRGPRARGDAGQRGRSASPRARGLAMAAGNRDRPGSERGADRAAIDPVGLAGGIENRSKRPPAAGPAARRRHAAARRVRRRRRADLGRPARRLRGRRPLLERAPLRLLRFRAAANLARPAGALLLPPPVRERGARTPARR